MEFRSQKFVLDDFQLELTLSGDSLLFEVTQLNPPKYFSLTINDEMADHLSMNIYPNIKSLFQAFMDFFQRKNLETKVSVTKEGKVLYCSEEVINGMKRIATFDIQLEEEKLDPMMKMERQLLKVACKINELERRSESEGVKRWELEQTLLEKINNIDKKVTAQDKKLDQLEMSVNERLQAMEEKFNEIKNIKEEVKMQITKAQEEVAVIPTFNEEKYSGGFIFSNDGKTVQRNGNGWACIFGDTPVPKKKRYKFSIRIDKLGSIPTITLGIAASTALNKNDVTGDQGTYGFGCHNARLYIRGICELTSLLPASLGSTVTVSSDFIAKNISFQIGNQLVQGELDGPMVDNYEFYPFVMMFNPGDIITFV